MSQNQTLPKTEHENREELLASGSITFIGTATVLLQYDSFIILTDPNFLHRGEKIHLGFGLTSERRTDPALELNQVHPFDLILLSHMHKDHFDREVEKHLSKHVQIVTNPEAAKALKKKGFLAVRPLATWENLTMVKSAAQLKITALPAKHGPGIMNAVLPAVMGSMLEFLTPAGKKCYRIYVSGDTLIHDDLRRIPEKFPDIDLALLHLGGTRVMGILLTMDATQGIEAIHIIRPRRAIPIHYNDYPIFKSPLEDFMAAVASAGLQDRVSYLHRGDAYRFQIPVESLNGRK